MNENNMETNICQVEVYVKIWKSRPGCSKHGYR